MTQTKLYIQGMDCSHEVAAVERALKPIDKVTGIKADISASSVTITHDPGLSSQEIIEAIRAVGLTASVADSNSSITLERLRRTQVVLVAVSGVLVGFAMLLDWLTPESHLPRILELLALLSAGYLIFPKAISAILAFRLEMNALMMVAALGALVLGDWAEAATVVFLFSLAELLESYSIARARNAIATLLNLAPQTALRKDGREARVDEVDIGDTILVRPGSRVPLDGEVSVGSSFVNQAPITGEAMPVEKNFSDSIFAGSINGDGTLEVRVTKKHSDTMLSRILHLVEEAQAQKAPSQRLVDTFAHYYTPTVFVLALLVMLIPPLFVGETFSDWFYRSLVLLVIACPCALVISTPVAVVSGLTALARNGVLIKGGAHLEELGRIRALAIDKTGTLTEGTPRVLEVIALNGRQEAEIVSIAASVDSHSSHPLAQAVVAYADSTNVPALESVNYQSSLGRGAQAEINGHPYFVGNHRFAHELAVCSESLEQTLHEIESQARSVVVVGHIPHLGCRGEVLGILAVGDNVRGTAKNAIASLRNVGLQKIIMLSGDNQRTAEVIGRAVGVDHVYGDLLPEDKITYVKTLMSEFSHVGMAGDGVNDAPALAAANVGIAMGGIGADTAIETADVTLMQDDLEKLAIAITVGRRVLSVIRANITFAVGVKFLFLALALLGQTSLWLAIFADTGATLIVIANSLRLLRMRGGQCTRGSCCGH
jgi:Cd2+/Zn2+-exporting ATPase